MPQSLSAVYIHIIFSTKDRRPFLRDRQLRQSLHAYLGAISKQLDCPPILTGGVEDHIHMLTTLSRTETQSELVKELKRNSTLWIKQQEQSLRDFQWQSGYAIFSVSQSNLPDVKMYIADQEAHHMKKSFQDELRAFLRKHGLPFDEKYLWD